jgi:hypothetical protein
MHGFQSNLNPAQLISSIAPVRVGRHGSGGCAIFDAKFGVDLL